MTTNPLILTATWFIAVGSCLFGQEVQPATPAKVDQAELLTLGEMLYMSKDMSIDRTVSCASCHNPQKSFTDGLRHGKGVNNTTIDKNSPTLFGLAHIKGFPAPAKPNGLMTKEDFQNTPEQSRANVAQTLNLVRTKHAINPNRRIPITVVSLSLAERCAGPVENPAEMGQSLPKVAQQLMKHTKVREATERTFGKGEKLTAHRIADALEAYVLAIEPPETPYSRYVDGDSDALTAAELRGLEIFNTQGQCATCHSGPALSDGRMHILNPVHMGSKLSRSFINVASTKAPAAEPAQTEASAQTVQSAVPAQTMQINPNNFILGARGGFGGYGGLQLPLTQTLTLIDVGRTAPYFRTGHTATLKDAVDFHLKDLTAAAKPAFREMLIGEKGSLPKLPEHFAPPSEVQAPVELSTAQRADLVAFLKALSPRPTPSSSEKAPSQAHGTP